MFSGISSGAVLLDKPYRGDVIPTKLTDRSRWGNDGVWANITAIKLPSGLWVASYDGATSKITVGDTKRSIQTLGVWIYPDNHTRSIVDFDAGVHSVEISAGSAITATGWAAPTFYVNGTAGAAITLSAWNFIAVTTATAFLASGLVLGSEDTWYDGYAGLWKLYSHVLTPPQIRAMFQNQRRLFGV